MFNISMDGIKATILEELEKDAVFRKKFRDLIFKP